MMYELCNDVSNFQLLVTIFGFLASGIFIISSFTEWSDEPVITTLDSIAAPIEDIQFPTVTACQDASKPPDRLAPVEIILNSVAFECIEKINADFIGGELENKQSMLPFCNETDDIRLDFDSELRELSKKFLNYVATSNVSMNFGIWKNKMTELLPEFASFLHEKLLDKGIVIYIYLEIESILFDIFSTEKLFS